MTTANEEHQCRICLEVSRTEALISPCACRGSSEYVHQACLESWVTESRSTKCEICREPYKIKLFVQSPRSRWRWWLAAVDTPTLQVNRRTAAAAPILHVLNILFLVGQN